MMSTRRKLYYTLILEFVCEWKREEKDTISTMATCQSNDIVHFNNIHLYYMNKQQERKKKRKSNWDMWRPLFSFFQFVVETFYWLSECFFLYLNLWLGKKLTFDRSRKQIRKINFTWTDSLLQMIILRLDII